MRHCSIHKIEYFADCPQCEYDADLADTPHPQEYYDIPDFDDRPYDGDERWKRYELAIGAPNQHCSECRKHGICAYHRDWPHNMRIRRR